jgi:hypothetical protein
LFHNILPDKERKGLNLKPFLSNPTRPQIIRLVYPSGVPGLLDHFLTFHLLAVLPSRELVFLLPEFLLPVFPQLALALVFQLPAVLVLLLEEWALHPELPLLAFVVPSDQLAVAYPLDSNLLDLLDSLTSHPLFD